MVTHDYENLGDELFQMLCQALLTREFRNLQCFPVGMPDGGRDATASEAGRGPVIFQVKFSRNPAKLADPADWVEKAIKGEQEKIDRLASRGASRYILMTNVPGTSHLDAGTMDKVSRYLSDNVSIPASCWWRDDLDRRLENAFDLKMRYPAVLNGADITRIIWELATNGEDQQRQQRALNAYFSLHYRNDSTVRFKQVELVSTQLTDLFIDVPAIPAVTRSAKERNVIFAAYNRAAIRARRAQPRRGATGLEGDEPEREERYFLSDGELFVAQPNGASTKVFAGCADLLTDPEFISRFPNVVIEGAPGQGKSTLTQYLAQIQRARVLERTVTARYSKYHMRAPVALPFRIELRDLAMWVKGLDPWQSSHPDGCAHGRTPSLETAIAAHIEHASGGIKFDADDLLRLMASAPTVILLDALDEVPDNEDRANAVQAVVDALARFEGNAIRPQVIVTSRPTAIAGSPSFPAELFLHLSLAPIPEQLAVTYARKWAKARRLDEADRRALPSTLRTKMMAPHISMLAKNTMQLSILLSLVQRRGASLPDKRTELYNAYFEIFLDRESDKSPVVRDNRDLLFDIHRYLGFQLHAGAESSRTNGRVGHQKLARLLREYLHREHQPLVLIDALLAGMVERFGALVSRVQGQYEFEVQPLQEYFAAKFLNDTAPPSPPGRERSGTKSDRFDGIAPNPYWSNATRFLAGCFNKGELADLADRVCDLVNAPDQAHNPYPRTVAVSLLQDWVFSQSPRATRKVVRTVFNALGLCWATTGLLEAGRSSSLFLGPGGGGEYLAEICWEALDDGGRTERTARICRLLLRNSSAEELAHHWYVEYLTKPAAAQEQWAVVGSRLQAIRHLPDDERRSLLTDVGSPSWREFATAAVNSNSSTRGLGDNLQLQMFRQWLNSAIAARPPITPRMSSLRLGLAAYAVHPHTWWERLSFRIGTPSVMLEFFDQASSSAEPCPLPIKELLSLAKSWRVESTATSLGPWVDAVGLLDRHFGPSWIGLELGVMAAGITNPGERGAVGAQLFDKMVPLPMRTRYARRNRGNAEWWHAQAELISDEVQAALWCMAAGVWTNADVFSQLLKVHDNNMQRLTHDARRAVYRAIGRGRTYGFKSSRTVIPTISDLRCSTTVILAALRFAGLTNVGKVLLEKMDDPDTASFCSQWLLSRNNLDMAPSTVLHHLKEAHSKGGSVHVPISIHGDASRRSELSRLILESPNDVPSGAVAAATSVVLRRNRSYVPILKVAADQHWFEEDVDEEW